MKRIKIYVLFFMAPVLFFSCKKETRMAPAFSAPGYWLGHANPLLIGILNKTDGTSRLYILTANGDTASAFKYDGSYSVTGNNFHFLSNPDGNEVGFAMETGNTTEHSMSGTLSIQPPGQAVADRFAFEAEKQIYH